MAVKGKTPNIWVLPPELDIGQNGIAEARGALREGAVCPALRRRPLFSLICLPCGPLARRRRKRATSPRTWRSTERADPHTPHAAAW